MALCEAALRQAIRRCPKTPALHGLHEFGADDQAVRVIGERAGLEADHVHPPDRLGGRGVVGTEDETVVDPVDVLRAIGVGQHYSPPAPQFVEVPEHEPALGVRVSQPVACDVDVRVLLPRETSPLKVQRPVVQCRLVARGAGVDGNIFHPLQARDGQLHGGVLLLRRCPRLFPGPPDVQENEARGDQDQDQPDQHEQAAVRPPSVAGIARSFTFAGPGPVRSGSHDKLSRQNMIQHPHNKTTRLVNSSPLYRYPLRRGSRASRRPSPTKFTESTARAIAMPGKMIACCPWTKTPKPLRKASVSIAPHSGVGARAPRPRNESAATSRIAVASVRVACTMRGAVLFGSMPEKMIWVLEAPRARSASM